MLAHNTKAMRQNRGQRNYLSGLAAEDAIARDYQRRGYVLAARRWRGPGGEIDLILRNQDEVVFVEVKQSRSLHQASHRITPRQIARTCLSAEAFLSGEPSGTLTPVRFDAALADASGEFHIIENAFGTA